MSFTNNASRNRVVVSNRFGTRGRFHRRQFFCRPGEGGMVSGWFRSIIIHSTLQFPGGSEVKVSACNAGDLGWIPGSGRSPGEGNGNPLQYSCLENPMDRGAWWATVHGVAKSWTKLSDFTFSSIIITSAPLQLIRH